MTYLGRDGPPPPPPRLDAMQAYVEVAPLAFVSSSPTADLELRLPVHHEPFETIVGCIEDHKAQDDTKVLLWIRSGRSAESRWRVARDICAERRPRDIDVVDPAAQPKAVAERSA